MQSEAYKFSGATLVISALGFLLRWLQDMRIADETTGLAVNAPISWMVGALMVVMTGVLAGYVLYLSRYDLPATAAEALVGKTAAFGIISRIPAVLLALAGIYQIIKPEGMWVLMHRLCGGAMLLGAAGLAIIANAAPKQGEEKAGRRGAYLLFVFSMFWLITGYRDAAADPVLWRFVVEILAQSAILLAFFHTTGYFFGVPHTKWAMFMCNLAAFLCVMCAIDDNGLAQSLAYGAMAAQFLIWGFVITENLKTKPIQPYRPGDEL